MTKQTIKGWITYKPPYSAGGKPTLDFMKFKPEKGDDVKFFGVAVCEHSIELEIPDGFDPRAPMISALEAEREAVRKELGARIAQLNEQIARLQAIEYTPEAS